MVACTPESGTPEEVVTVTTVVSRSSDGQPRGQSLWHAASPCEARRTNTVLAILISALLQKEPSRRPSNVLPFSGERRTDARSYHGREEPRASARGVAARPAFERAAQAFSHCNGLLDRATVRLGAVLPTG